MRCIAPTALKRLPRSLTTPSFKDDASHLSHDSAIALAGLYREPPRDSRDKQMIRRRGATSFSAQHSCRHCKTIRLKVEHVKVRAHKPPVFFLHPGVFVAVKHASQILGILAGSVSSIFPRKALEKRIERECDYADGNPFHLYPGGRLKGGPIAGNVHLKASVIQRNMTRRGLHITKRHHVHLYPKRRQKLVFNAPDGLPTLRYQTFSNRRKCGGRCHPYADIGIFRS